jgi:CzcA family heavy metal efflux pump
MLRGIINTSLNFRFLVIVIAVVLMGVGIVQLRAMPVDVLPEFTPPYVEIRTEALGLSAQEVEQLITLGMEQDLLNGVPWLDTIRSESVPGLSSIVLTFEPGTDLLRARQMVSERLAQAFALPHVSKPPTMIQPLSSTSRFMIIGLSSKELSLIQMSVLARWTIGPRLMGVPGVANVAIWGNRDRQLQVQVNPKKLAEKGVTLGQVLETAGNALWVSSLSFLEASTPGTGGFIDTANQRLGIWHISPISSAKDLAQVPVEGAKSLYLGDVAKVVENHQPLIGDGVINDNSNLLLVVEKFPGANTLEVTRGVEDALAALSQGMPGVQMNTSIYRPADFIETSVANIGTVFLIGFFMLIVILALFLFEWRAALIGVVSLSLSAITAGFVIYLRGGTMNAIVLAGLLMALSVMVDDALIDVEKILRSLRQSRESQNPQPTMNIVLEASFEVRSTIFYSTLIVLLAVSPVFFLSGPTRTFFQPLVVSYVLAILISMLVALIVTPALALILFGISPIGQHVSPLVRWIQPAYERMLAWFAQRPRMAFATIVVALIIGLVVLPFLSLSPVPSFKERDIQIHMNGAPGTSQPEMSRIIMRVSSELRTIPGVQDVGAHVGRAIFGDQVVNVNSSELWVSIDPAADYGKTLTAIRNVVNGYPGFQSEVKTFMQERTSTIFAQTDNTMVVRMYGDRLELLRSKVDDVKKALAGIEGVGGWRVALPVVEPTLEIEVDLAKAQKYGIKPGDVRRTATTLVSGIMVGNLFEEQKVFDVVVWGSPETRNSLSSVRDMLIDIPGGKQIRVGDVADVRIVPAPTVIKHEAVKRYIDLTASVQGRSLDAVAADVRSHLDQVQFPLEYYARVLGVNADQQAARTRLFTIMAAAILGIFLILQAVYRSWIIALLSFLVLFAGLAGGFLAVFITGGVISLGSLIGFMAAFGISARNGFMLLDHYQQAHQPEKEDFGLELIVRSASDRSVAVLMTAFTTGLMLISSLFFGDIPGLEVIRPMAIVVLGSLVTSTFFSLFVLPAIYLRYGSRREPELDLSPSTTLEIPASAADD